jgi:hypothetical protein
MILSFAFDAGAQPEFARSHCGTATFCFQPRSASDMQIFLLIEQNCKFRSGPLAITLKSRWRGQIPRATMSTDHRDASGKQ